MSEDREQYQVKPEPYTDGPVYLMNVHLTPDCTATLKIEGKITWAAINRLIAFLKLMLPAPEKKEEEQPR